MSILTAARQRLAVRREEGQALIIMVVTLVVLLGFAGLVVDFGRAYLAERQLQQAVDAASLAAGQTLPNSTDALQEAIEYSATGTNKHPYSMDAQAPTVKFLCSTKLAANNVRCNPNNDPNLPTGASTACNGTSGFTTPTCNAVQVSQKATVSTFFARLFVPHLTVSAKSTAGMRGGVPHPLNIMIVLDRTASMDEDCNEAVNSPIPNQPPIITAANSQKIDCAKDGVRKLLTGLLPCNQNINGACGTAAPLDQVGLMVFPALNNKNGTNHSLNNDASHTNLNLETSSSCSGEYKSNSPNATNPLRPPWYLPGNLSFPRWFLTANDVGYGTAADNEYDVVRINQNAGTFTLTFNGPGGPQTTGNLNWNAPATGGIGPVASVLNALTSLSNIGPGNVTVTKNPNNGTSAGTYTITYVGALAGRDVGPLSAAAQGVATPAPTVLTTRPGSPPGNERQDVTVPQTTGTFTLTFDGDTTSNISAGASAATVQSQLIALGSVPNGGVSVVRLGSGPYTYQVTFQGGLAGTDVPTITGTSNNTATGTAPTITTLLDGSSANANEIQAVTVTSGNITLSFNGSTTGNIAFGASAATVQAQLIGLTSIPTGGVTVTRSGAGPYTYAVTFTGGLGNQDVVQMTSTGNSSVGTNTEGSPRNEIRSVVLNQTTGTFTLSFNGQTTGALAWNASAATVQGQLIGLSSIPTGGVTVTRSGAGPYTYTVTFTGGLGNQNVTLALTGAATVPAAGPTAVVVTTGGTGTDEMQTVTVSQTMGSFTLTFNGQTTDPIPFNASAGDVEDALVDLGAIDGNDVNVTKSGNVFTITFLDELGDQDVPQIIANSGTIITNPSVFNTPYVPGINADYSFAPLSNNFRLSNAQGLNPASRLVQAITWSSCVGLRGQGSGINAQGFASETAQGYPFNQYYGINAVSDTYYAGAVNAAQAALNAEAAAFPLRNAQPVIILLSDGAANTGGTTPCHSAIDASHSAATAGTWVYSIAYHLDGTRCKQENGNDEIPTIDDYTTMANIARNSDQPDQLDFSKFFCVGTTSRPALPCQNGATLAQVFQSIGTSLTAPRLYPDDIDAPS